MNQRDQLSRSTTENLKHSVINPPLTPDGGRSSSTQDTGLKDKTTADSAIYKSEYSRQTGNGLGMS